MKILRGEEIPETVEYGISSFIYRANRPFHAKSRHAPGKSRADLGYGILRSKGFLWIASRNDQMGIWSQAGGVASLEGASAWYDGSKMQELVVIGREMKEPEIRRCFDSCLLSNDEMTLGHEQWALFRDPIPAWETETISQ